MNIKYTEDRVVNIVKVTKAINQILNQRFTGSKVCSRNNPSIENHETNRRHTAGKSKIRTVRK